MPRLIFSMFVGAWRSSPSWKIHPNAPANPRPMVVLPEPETPMTITTTLSLLVLAWK
jgi:hypothetical protein